MIMPLLLMVYLFVAAAMDMVWRKVKNIWIIYGLVSGLVLSFLDSGLFGNGGCHLQMGSDGLVYSFIGMIMPLPLLYLYYYHIVGAGDIKLLMVVGSFLGVNNLFEAIIPIIICAGISAIITLIKNYQTLFKCKHYMPIAPAILSGIVLWKFGVI